jgi:hypothetical protein
MVENTAEHTHKHTSTHNSDVLSISYTEWSYSVTLPPSLQAILGEMVSYVGN